ncbi:MAG TPA: (2Fe-2S)-binding protein [Vineibacter sp.]|nr:(2Fe-2S)-binding protein [Vineibacter sp.]
MTESITVRINGADRSIDAAPSTPLLTVLRDTLGLAGTRFGCGSGDCGTCMVLLDGRPVTACDLPLDAVAGKSVITIEGLGTQERPHPLQTAFIAEQALQCGYCVSGIIVSAAALLAANPTPTAAEVRQALDRNLCRCGAHNRMVRAVLRAAKGAAA